MYFSPLLPTADWLSVLLHRSTSDGCALSLRHTNILDPHCEEHICGSRKGTLLWQLARGLIDGTRQRQGRSCQCNMTPTELPPPSQEGHTCQRGLYLTLGSSQNMFSHISPMVKCCQVAMHFIKIMSKWINNWKDCLSKWWMICKKIQTVTLLKVKDVIKLKSIKLCVRRARHVQEHWWKQNQFLTSVLSTNTYACTHVHTLLSESVLCWCGYITDLSTKFNFFKLKHLPGTLN